MLDGLLFTLNQGLAAALSLALARAVFAGDEPWRRAFAALAAFPLIAAASILLANHLLGLSAAATTAVLLGAGLAALRLRGRVAPRAVVPSATPRRRDPLARVAVALAAGLGLTWLVRTALLGTSFVWDDLSYHAALPARWLSEGSISVVPFTYQTYFPQNAELLSLWFVLPFGRDAHANLAALTWGAVAAASIALLARAIGGRGLAPAAAVTLFFASSVVWLPAGTFSATDLAGTATLLAALVFLRPAPGRRAPAARSAAASGLLAGFAVGCKSLFVPAAAGLALLWALPHRGEARNARLGRGAAFVACALVTGSYWYLRNWWVAGNPLFPAEFAFFDGPFDAATQARTRLATLLFTWPPDLDLWQRVVTTRSHWPRPLALLAAMGYASALSALWRRRGPAARLRSAVCLTGLATAIAYPFLPFSATNNRPDLVLHAGTLRFLLLPYAAGCALLAARLRRGAPLRDAWVAVGALGLLLAWPAQSPLAPVALAGAAAALALSALRLPDEAWQRLRGRPGAAWAAVAAASAALALWTPVKQQLTDLNLFAFGAERGRVGAAWAALEGLPPGSHIAFFMAEPREYTQYYATFGRAYQHVPVPVEPDGSPRHPLHEGWRKREGWWSDWAALDHAIDPATLKRNLVRAGVDYALVTRWSLDAWPAQYAALRGATAEPPVYDDGYSVLWRIPKGPKLAKAEPPRP